MPLQELTTILLRHSTGILAKGSCSGFQRASQAISQASLAMGSSVAMATSKRRGFDVPCLDDSIPEGLMAQAIVMLRK